MSELSKEEILAFTESHTKVAISLEKIVDSLADLTLKQEKLLDKLTARDSYFKDIEIIKDDVVKCKDNIVWLKIIFGAITLIVGIAVAITQVIHTMGHIVK